MDINMIISVIFTFLLLILAIVGGMCNVFKSERIEELEKEIENLDGQNSILNSKLYDSEVENGELIKKLEELVEKNKEFIADFTQKKDEAVKEIQRLNKLLTKYKEFHERLLLLSDETIHDN